MNTSFFQALLEGTGSRSRVDLEIQWFSGTRSVIARMEGVFVCCNNIIVDCFTVEEHRPNKSFHLKYQNKDTKNGDKRIYLDIKY